MGIRHGSGRDCRRFAPCIGHERSGRRGYRTALPRRDRARRAACARRRAPSASGSYGAGLRRAVPPGSHSSTADPQGLGRRASRRRRRSHRRASSVHRPGHGVPRSRRRRRQSHARGRASARATATRSTCRAKSSAACNIRKVETVLSDGCSVPVPHDSVTLAYSFQVMEHIHPDDALEQLRNLFAVIAPGGSLRLRDAEPAQRSARRVEILRPRGARLSSQGIHHRRAGALFRGVGFGGCRRIRDSAAATCECRWACSRDSSVALAGCRPACAGVSASRIHRESALAAAARDQVAALAARRRLFLLVVVGLFVGRVGIERPADHRACPRGARREP